VDFVGEENLARSVEFLHLCLLTCACRPDHRPAPAGLRPMACTCCACAVLGAPALARLLLRRLHLRRERCTWAIFQRACSGKFEQQILFCRRQSQIFS